nr:cytohesin-3 [Macaca fascicularis]
MAGCRVSNPRAPVLGEFCVSRSGGPPPSPGLGVSPHPPRAAAGAGRSPRAGPRGPTPHPLRAEAGHGSRDGTPNSEAPPGGRRPGRDPGRELRSRPVSRALAPAASPALGPSVFPGPRSPARSGLKGVHALRSPAFRTPPFSSGGRKRLSRVQSVFEPSVSSAVNHVFIGLGLFLVPEDLSLEEREELLDIRRRKKELIDDIERLKYEIAEVMTEIDNLTSVEESKTTQRNKQIAMGRKKFNMDPKKGIQFLIENDLLQSSPEDVAQFLYKGEGLNKTVIGDYLGERDEFNIKVLQAFVELHEFADLNLVQALRQFLWSFRLPGEAQKIDRMMEAFASRYCLCNPGVFQSTDTCYVLSFAIIMLNTSLHNHNVRDKPTAERFIAMNRGINEGGDLPEELLRNLYESIKNEPFKIPEDDGNDLTHTFFNPDREGWLLKLGGRVKTWKRRWFILTDNCLYYFEYTTDKEPRGIIPLENLSIREVEDPRKPNCFELYNPSHKGQVIKACKTEADGRVVEGNHVVYRISAPSPEEKEEWMKSIKASISRDPFYDMLATRKRRIANKK